MLLDMIIFIHHLTEWQRTHKKEKNRVITKIELTRKQCRTLIIVIAPARPIGLHVDRQFRTLSIRSS